MQVMMQVLYGAGEISTFYDLDVHTSVITQL